MDSFCERIILSWWLLFIASQDFPFYYTTIIMKEHQGVTKGLLQPKHLSTEIQEVFLLIIITDKNDKLCQNRDTRNPRGIFRWNYDWYWWFYWWTSSDAVINMMYVSADRSSRWPTRKFDAKKTKTYIQQYQRNKQLWK